MSLITITSGIGCSENTVARILGEKLGLAVFDDQKLQDEALEMGISSEDIKDFDEKAPSLFSRLLTFKPQTYLELMAAVIYKISGKGDAIIAGHGASFLLRDFGCAFHVRLHSSKSSRIQHLVDEQGMSPDAAKKLMQKNDDEQKGFLRFAYRMDWDDNSLYDLVINRDKLGVEGTVILIVAARDVEQIKECSLSAMESMKQLSLGKRVEAAIIKDCVNPGNYHVTVPEPGVVRLTGIINPLESKDRLIELVKAIPGVKKLIMAIEPERIHDI